MIVLLHVLCFDLGCLGLILLLVCGYCCICCLLVLVARFALLFVDFDCCLMV